MWHCRLTFYVENTGVKISENGAFVAGRVSMASGYDQQQLTLWQEKVRLDKGFLKSLREHPVPVREEAISAIGTRSLQIRVSGTNRRWLVSSRGKRPPTICECRGASSFPRGFLEPPPDAARRRDRGQGGRPKNKRHLGPVQ